MVYASHPEPTREAYWQAVKDACARITPEMIKKMMREFIPRIGCCRMRQGKQFEPWLKEYKLEFAKLPECNRCNKKHTCSCQKCEAFCHQRQEARDASHPPLDEMNFQFFPLDAINIDQEEWEAMEVDDGDGDNCEEDELMDFDFN